MFENFDTLHLAWIGLLHTTSIMGVLLALLLISRVLRSPRRPSTSMGWLFVIIFFPLLGIPLYLIFGERKLDTLIKQKGLVNMPKLPVTDIHPINSLLVSLGIPSACGGNKVMFHNNGAAAWDALVTLLESARKNIDIAIFVLADDQVGKKVLSILEDKAAQGIKIRLLLDGVGSFTLPKIRLQTLIQQGGQVAWFIPVLHKPLRGKTNLRNHRKIIIVDDENMWSGGRNLAAEYLCPKSSRECWIDLSFTQQGPVIATYRMIFEADWQFSSQKNHYNAINISPIIAENNRKNNSDSHIQVIPSGPDIADDPIYETLLMACYSANKHIILVTPYYVPDSGLQEALKLAALRGIVVDMILPEQSNHRLADIARKRYLRELDRAGVKIWLLPEQMVHAKALVIDNTFAMTGSANLDIRSLFLNCEVMNAFYSKTDILWLENWLITLRHQCFHHRPQNAGALREIMEGMVLLAAYQL